ncbi:hypothetical protein PENTCL1PPCAC_21251, partial [Pristionchus entomophagus]
ESFPANDLSLASNSSPQRSEEEKESQPAIVDRFSPTQRHHMKLVDCLNGITTANIGIPIAKNSENFCGIALRISKKTASLSPRISWEKKM